MQSQTQQLQPSSVLAEDDVIKKNTDCVYFLASPLTCKKGKECEFRHSDLARLNPRDCYYWLQGNCLNPKCAFRHPPLDGLLEKQKPAPTGPSPHAFQTNATAFTHVPNSTSTPGVPCVFFQKGYCLKGDWCPFLHGPPNSASNKVLQAPESTPSFEPAPSKRAFSGVDKLTQEKKVLPTSAFKNPHAKSSTEVEVSVPKQDFFVNKKAPHTSVVSDFREHKNVRSVPSGYLGVPQPHILGERRSVNDREAGEISREPSPGFDVLVDDERGDAHYYPEDRYEISRDHEARNEHTFKDHYPREHRVSNERTSGGSSFERNPYGRMDSRAEVDASDLRHRLVNPKRSNGLRSVISHERSRDRHDEDRRLPRRDAQHLPRLENSVSSRLRGRIRLPGRSSSPSRDMARSSDRGRLSPVMPNLSHQQGRRTHDRLRGMVDEDFGSGRRNRRDVMYNESANFAAPKRLSELKNRKNGEHCEEHMTDQQLPGKRKHMVLEDHNITGNDASFEGPKPLQEILKRKRGDTVGIVGSKNSSYNEDIVEDNNQNARQDSVNPNEEIKVQPEDYIPVEDGMEQEYEAYEEEGYEQVGGEEELYEGDENEYIEGEEEFHDEEEDDDDDFAKKMGVDFS